jgi:asparagine synthase (glutamine-hydrolysing)
MCGLIGIAGRASDLIDDDTIQASLDLIRHRGPDAAGIWRRNGIAMGHRRLAIVDLNQHADQPMRHGDLIVVFNGEIYNYKEIRRELKMLGHSFRTGSDTEVLLQSWQRWGPDCVLHFEGMFAFAIWDVLQNKLYLARDRYGEKPLFVHECREGIAFASEMPPLIRLAGNSLQEDRSAIGLFFLYSYIPAPYSALQGISQLEPGCWLEWSAQGGLIRHKYYNLQTKIAFSAAQPQPSYKQACEIARSMIEESVRQRVETADVPVASMLSGGIDSSIVTILTAKASKRPISVYSLGFPADPAFDETKFAKEVTATLPNAKHKIVEATESSVLNFAENVLDKLGEPFADASILPTALLCSEINEKVVLGGDAADEIFAGYGIYPAIVAGAKLPNLVRNLLGILPPHSNPSLISNGSLRAAALFHRHLRGSPLESYLSWRSYADRDLLVTLGIDTSATAAFAATLGRSGAKSLADVQALDLAFNLPNDMLKKVDYASMFYSLEVRLPFLDSNLVHWALGLPDEYRLKGRIRKRILRDAFVDILPEMVLKRGKMGFLLPIRQWFREGRLRDELDALLRTQTVIDRNIGLSILSDHVKGLTDHSVLLWSIFVYLHWRRRLPSWSMHNVNF